jgi:gamma-glutamylcyclotransferase (GGCT)/AIG2-like uncharacterized protein YtfP
MTTRPFFVYGTLRPYGALSGVWTDMRSTRHTHDGMAQVTGYRLVTNGSFPYAIPAEGDITVGALVHVAEWEYDRLLTELDRIEGYPAHYDRITVQVADLDGDPISDATMYVPTIDPTWLANYDPVPGNDWYTYMLDRLLHEENRL